VIWRGRDCGNGGVNWKLSLGSEQMLFVINNPEVYKSPNSNTYM
jgi:hypothetical protein